ncbi:MAG: hypothetical protein CME70_07770 [Halobacteriovorax sp.]|nr:hypothetical protein [Halobacteriovorax sp.]|tara:strand:- start:280990 stop:281988 length:999 start_codon:yes stop_codon:yes gene_type:complete
MKPEETERLFIESLFKNSGLQEGEIKVDKLTGDASTRRYFRLVTKKNSYVACLDNPIGNEERYDFEEMQSVLKKSNVRVPEIFYLNREKGFILEEDLGNTTLLEALGQTRSKKEKLELYYPVLDELIKIHAINPEEHKGACFTKLRFDTAKLLDETRVTNANFIIKLLKTDPNDPSINIIDQAFSGICKFLDTEPVVVTHRDFHSRNLMLVEGKPVVIDFQDARMGLPQYDLVSLLEDCYFFVNKEVKQELLEYYLDKSSLKMENFEKYYDFMAIQRLYKAIGSFSLIYNTRDDSRYLKFIGRAFETVLAKLSRYEQLTDLKVTLAKIYYAS